MQGISLKGLKKSIQTDYIMKAIGLIMQSQYINCISFEIFDRYHFFTYAYNQIIALDICANTTVGDAMRIGISGGQKKRLTTGK